MFIFTAVQHNKNEIQCCGSRILIFTHPGSDSKTATKERGEKKFVVITFYVATNLTKLQIILILKCCRKKFGPIFKEL
jgi:hypothetical protein